MSRVSDSFNQPGLRCGADTILRASLHAQRRGLCACAFVVGADSTIGEGERVPARLLELLDGGGYDEKMAVVKPAPWIRRGLISLVLLAVAACSKHGGRANGADDATSRPGSAPTGRADRAVELLTNRLLKPRDAEDAARAAAEAYAWAGLPTHSWKEQTQAAVAPIVPIVTPDFLALRLAEDYALGAGAHRISLELLGDWLARLGWGPSGSSPGQALGRVLAAMVTAARARPEAAESFVPLFIARSQKTMLGVDVSRADVPAGDIALTLLELRLFLSAHFRGTKDVVDTGKSSQDSHFSPARLAKAIPVFASPPPGPPVPPICSQLFKRWEWLDHLMRGRADMGSSLGISMIYRRLNIGDRAASAIYAYLRLLDFLLVMRDNSVSVVLISQESKAHKPSGSVERSAHFTAHVYVREDLSEFEKMARDCGNALGFDNLTQVDLEKCRVYWDEPASSHDFLSIPDRNNFHFAQPKPGHRVRKVGPYEGRAELVVDIVDEDQHRASAEHESAKAWMRAELNTVEAPNIESILSPLTLAGEISPLALGQELVEIARSTYRELNPTVGSAFVSVEWCKSEVQEWVGNITYRQEFRMAHTDEPKTASNGTQSGSAETTMTQTANVSVNGRTSSGSVTMEGSIKAKSDRHWMQQCEYKKHVFQKKIQQHSDSVTRQTARASGPVEAGAAVSPDGSYVVSFATPRELWGRMTVKVNETQVGCEGNITIPHDDVDERWKTVGFSHSASGTGYAGTGALTGRLTEKSPDGMIVTTMTWSLTPKPKR